MTIKAAATRLKQGIEVLEAQISMDRKRKMASRLAFRTRRIRIVLDGVRNMGNAMACMRTADAHGIQYVHVVAASEGQQGATMEDALAEDLVDRSYANRIGRHTGSYLNHLDQGQHGMALDQRLLEKNAISQNVHQWLTIHHHSCPKECATMLKNEGYRVLVTELSPDAVFLTPQVIQSHPLFSSMFSSQSANEGDDGGIALVFGNEKRGISAAMKDLADGRFMLPMFGFAQSYNVSVSVAITLSTLANTPGILSIPQHGHEVCHSGMSDDERQLIYLQWLVRSGKHARKVLKGKGYSDVLEHLDKFQFI